MAASSGLRFSDPKTVFAPMGGGWIDLADHATAVGKDAPIVDRSAQQPLF
jgi:hypothetical protein